MGALSLTHSKPIQRQYFGPLVPEVYHAPYGDIDYLEKKVFKKLVSPKELAAVFVESMQGEGGYYLPPKEFLPRLRRWADKYKFLLIDDEIQTGLGRTGKMFAIEHYGVVPDVVCVAKGIASGMPMGAIIARKNLMRWVPGAHANTFGGNPVSCVAALATLDLIEKKYLVNTRRVGSYLAQQLKKLQKKHSYVSEVRGMGLMLAMEIARSGRSMKPDPKKRDQIIMKAFKQGLLLLGCGESAIRFIPPLCVTKKEVDTAIGILDKAL